MTDINANNKIPVINLMISMQSSKQTDSHITLNFCVAVERFTYLVSKLFDLFIIVFLRIPYCTTWLESKAIKCIYNNTTIRNSAI